MTLRPFRLSLVLLLVAACVEDTSSKPTVDGGTSDASSGGKEDGFTPGSDGSVEGDAGIALLTDAVAIAAGAEHTCALRASQDVICWGGNGSGQLGVPAAQTPRSSVPVRVTLPDGGKAKAIAAGTRHTCALMTTGKIACWGENTTAQLGRSPLDPVNPNADYVVDPIEFTSGWKGASAIAGGGGHTQALVPAGALVNGKDAFWLWGWGKNAFGQLTRDSFGFPVSSPLVATLDGKEPTPSMNQLPVLAIALGDDFGCAQGFIPTPGGSWFERVVCFGASGKKQTGTLLPGSTNLGAVWLSETVALALPRGVAAGAQHACAIGGKVGGGESLYCWGDFSMGQTGQATPPANAGYGAPVPDVDGTAITVFAAGGNNTCVVENSKTRCIGANDEGQLASGKVDADPHPSWSNVTLPSASALAVGRKHVCAILGAAAGSPGRVSCWGLNRTGQLGDGIDLDKGYADGTFSRPAPVAVRAVK
ncbi:MAG: hypothetical protein U0174_08370 [Polyangiaceae bacterium]